MNEQQAERLVTAIEQLTEHMALVVQSNAMLIRAITEEAGQEELGEPTNHPIIATLDPA